MSTERIKMKRATHKPNRERRIEDAIIFLRPARNAMREAGASRAANYVARAIKSADGARRHAAGVANNPRTAGNTRS